MLSARPPTDQIIDNAIDLDPEYQRGRCLLVERIAGVVAGSDRLFPKDVVWQEEKQSGLIDSILRNYYIPPIIFGTCIFSADHIRSLNEVNSRHSPRGRE